MQYLDFEKSISELDQKIEEANASGRIEESRKLKMKLMKVIEEIYSSLTPWQKVQVARHPDRPQALDYISGIFTKFLEFHGDRTGGDDRAIIAGAGEIEGRKIFIIAQQKGKNVRERKERNFGMPGPEGYRKALRIMNLAERFGKPLLTIVDTPGAYPGIEAEEKGQAFSIAQCIERMLSLRVPTISLIIGEGGSGGALAICVADKILMMKYSTLSVISPEGCASILFRNGSKAHKAAENLHLTSDDLKRLNIIDEIIDEPLGGAHRDPKTAIENAKEGILKYLNELTGKPINELLEERNKKYLNIGEFRRQIG